MVDKLLKSEKIRFYNVDFLRFVFAIQVVIHHIACNWVGLNDFRCLLKSHFLWSNAVEYFFIIAGFFMFCKIDKSKDTFIFIKSRYLRLAPIVLVFIILSAIFSIFVKGWIFSFDGNILTLFLLQAVGFTKGTTSGGVVTGALWFVSVLFWCSIFYFYLYKVLEEKWFNLIVWLLIIISYSINLHCSGFRLTGISANVYYFINMGVLRGLGGLGLGYFVAMVYKSGFLQQDNKKFNIIYSILETILLIFYVYFMLFSSNYPSKNALVYVVWFVILFYVFLLRKGFISKFLNNKKLGDLGKYAYCIYIMHPLVLYFFKLTIFRTNKNFVLTHMWGCLLFEALITLIFCVIIYYCFERPINRLVKQLNN